MILVFSLKSDRYGTFIYKNVNEANFKMQFTSVIQKIKKVKDTLAHGVTLNLFKLYNNLINYYYYFNYREYRKIRQSTSFNF